MDLLQGKPWHVHHGDCIEHLHTLPDHCFDMSVYSPPFPSVFSYQSLESDIGNSEDLYGDGKLHLSFFYKAMLRVMKPGRVMMVHVAQIQKMKRSGGLGVFDFRGLNIKLAERAGFIYEYDWGVRKNPQALKNGTMVLTPDSWKAIDSLKVGQEVIGSDGNPTVVKGVYPHEPRQMFKVLFSDGTFVECDSNHLWQVETRKGPSKTMTTEEMRNIGAKSPSGEPRFRIPIMSSPAKLDCGYSRPIDAYTLGVILGDGSTVTRGSTFLTTDHDIVENTQLPINHSWRRIKGSDKGGGTVATYVSNGSRWHHNEILSSLKSLGVSGMRAWEKSVPHTYLFAPAWDRLELLRGLMDTDGTIKTNSGIVCKFCSTSKRLAEDVAFLAQSLGGVTRIDTEDDSRYQYKGEWKTGRRKYLVSLRMPEGCNPFKMERKAARWKPTRKSICRWVVAIEPTSIEPCTCIEVSAADCLYVTENCIVTHNSQAIRTRSRELQFAGLENDRARSRGAMPDFLLKFVAPGENKVAVDSEGEVSRNEGIKWAEWCWDDIRETDTLNTKEAKGPNDTRHICALQLEVIDRLVRLYSNPEEIVFSPFCGVGSEGYQALKRGRRFYGCELKPEYYQASLRNLSKAEGLKHDSQPVLFDAAS